MDTQRLDNTFAALADPTRRAIVNQLAKGEASVSELAQPFDMSLPAIFKHLGVLEEAGLISSQKKGRVRTCKLKADPMKVAAQWLDYYSEFWDSKLDAFEKFLDEQEKRPKAKSGTKKAKNKSTSSVKRRPKK